MLSLLHAAVAQPVDYLQGALSGFSCIPAQHHLCAPSRSPSVTDLEKNDCRSNINPGHALFTPHRPEPNTIGILEDLLCRPLPSPCKTMGKKSGN